MDWHFFSSAWMWIDFSIKIEKISNQKNTISRLAFEASRHKRPVSCEPPCIKSFKTVLLLQTKGSPQTVSHHS
eukprot:5295503-Amphidinium_carterae.1